MKHNFILLLNKLSWFPLLIQLISLRAQPRQVHVSIFQAIDQIQLHDLHSTPTMQVPFTISSGIHGYTSRIYLIMNSSPVHYSCLCDPLRSSSSVPSPHTVPVSICTSEAGSAREPIMTSNAYPRRPLLKGFHIILRGLWPWGYFSSSLWLIRVYLPYASALPAINSFRTRHPQPR
ncbi:hypothetical protein DER46DRAFT_155439 [Fusarium sp. MPI-SDFR-AT-0072]|nr:hypothetical protein DER46DRAFT_155439 [Fusarium sp. MPI-SDFR-AT-0072]